MRNTMSNTTLVSRIDELASKRQAWENGTYKASNDELYGLLQDCYDIYMQVSGNRTLIKRLSKLLEERQLTEQSNTSLATRIVRLVFGECGKRVYIYARVLTVAAEEKSERMSMRTFIDNAGGVESLRRKKAGDVSTQQLNVKRVEFAQAQLSHRKALANKIKVAKGMQSGANSKYQYTVAIIRCDSNSEASIVYATDNEALVRSALLKAGKALQADKAEEDLLKQKLTKLAQRKNEIDKLAA